MKSETRNKVVLLTIISLIAVIFTSVRQLPVYN